MPRMKSSAPVMLHEAEAEAFIFTCPFPGYMQKALNSVAGKLPDARAQRAVLGVPEYNRNNLSRSGIELQPQKAEKRIRAAGVKAEKLAFGGQKGSRGYRIAAGIQKGVYHASLFIELLIKH